MAVELYPHQQKAVDELGNGKILYGDVGVGKSLTALAYFFTKVCGGELNKWDSLKTPKDVYVITTAKKRDSLDWQHDGVKFHIGPDLDASLPDVTLWVDSWNNIGRYIHVKDAFFVFDEQRVVGSGAWTKSFIKIARNNQWILLSATPGDTWMDYIPVFVANGWYKNRTAFINEHVIWDPWSKHPKVRDYMNKGKLLKYRREVLVHMPYPRHTKRIIQDICVDYDKDQFEEVWEKKWNVFEKRPIRDRAELFSVVRKVVNSHGSRVEAVKRLMQRHPKLIVFYNFDYELEQLREIQKDFPRVDLTKALSNGSPQLPEATSDSQTSGSTIQKDSSKPEESPLQKRSDECVTKRSSSKAHTATSKDATGSSLNVTTTTQSGSIPNLEATSGCQTSGKLQKSSAFERSDVHILSSVSKKSDVSGGEVWMDYLEGSSRKDLSSETGNAGNSKMDMAEPSGSMTKDDSSTFSIAEWNGHKHQEIPKSDRWLYLVQYTAGAEGWNCIETDAMAFYSRTYSYRAFHQCHGRIDRLNTPFTFLYYYNLVSKSLIDQAIGRALKSKKSFNESSFARRYLDTAKKAV